ncbi:MAG: transposase, partial [Actinobacteria bacterium]|nr:transposase [Actinomycetota bacterium]
MSHTRAGVTAGLALKCIPGSAVHSLTGCRGQSFRVRSWTSKTASPPREDCREYLFASRWPEGFGCRRCGGGEIGVMHRRRVVTRPPSSLGPTGIGEKKYADVKPMSL